VFVEQFNKIGRHSKTLHADIHPGNIFIDVQVLQGKKKGKIFTLIDTGNTIDLSKEQALRTLKLTSYIQNGNYKDITNYVLEGAALPAGMTKEQAVQKVGEEMKTLFFDTKTKIDSMNNDSMLTLACNVMRKYNIIPNDSQLNLNKAKQSAGNSLRDLACSLFSKKFANIDDTISTFSVIGSTVKEAGVAFGKYKAAVKWQEFCNLFKMSPKEFWKQFRNPNMNKMNSKEYLIYKFKQDMPGPEKGLLDGLDGAL